MLQKIDVLLFSYCSLFQIGLLKYNITLITHESFITIFLYALPFDLMCFSTFFVLGRSLRTPLVKILDDRSATRSTMFVRQLHHELSKKYSIDTDVIDSIDETDSDSVLIVVCNRSHYSSMKNAVEQYGKDVKRNNLFFIFFSYISSFL